MTDNFKALTAVLWLEPLVEENVSEAGIFLGDNKPVTKGKIVAIGAKCDKEIVEHLEVGDHVLFEAHHPTKLKIQDKEYLLLLDRNAICKIDPDKLKETELLSNGG